MVSTSYVLVETTVSFGVMEAEGITGVLGVDDDFTAEGFRLLC
jgi:hypothetical protein